MISFTDADSALAAVSSGAVVLVGGFGLVGQPLALVASLGRTAAIDLTIVSNNLGEAGQGLGILLRQRKVRRAVGSYFTSNPEVGAAFERGDLELEVVPQGTLAESLRAAGAGIPAFFTPTGAGTELAHGREMRAFTGRECVMEHARPGDVALIKAWQCDRYGNLTYRRTAQNFNPLMAMAAQTVVAEVEEMVECIDPPELIHTPAALVDYVVCARGAEGATR